jgi:glucose-6-phosphate-specific signal transduction histidine kinase
MARKIAADSGGLISQFGPPLLVTILVVGLVADLMQRPVLQRWFWQGLLVLLAASNLGVVLLALYHLVCGGVAQRWQGIIVIGALLLLPGLIKLKRYAFDRGFWSAGG